jgi:hypothetical protein
LQSCSLATSDQDQSGDPDVAAVYPTAAAASPHSHSSLVHFNSARSRARTEAGNSAPLFRHGDAATSPSSIAGGSSSAAASPHSHSSLVHFNLARSRARTEAGNSAPPFRYGDAATSPISIVGGASSSSGSESGLSSYCAPLQSRLNFPRHSRGHGALLTPRSWPWSTLLPL